MAETQKIGIWGEQAAAEWLHSNGFELLHRNWRSGRYELDIVAARPGTIHFIEVKTRRAGGLTSPEQAITGSKARSMQLAAQAYIAYYGIEQEPQFDLIAVEYSSDRTLIRYIADAVTPSW